MLNMKKQHKRRLLAWETENPRFIILNSDAQVYIGLKQGYAQFSDDVDKAKILEGQGVFDTMKRFTQMPLEQMFI